ncbi:MAG: type 4a pilus biogenesis protein PilO [Candidatus Ancaeobacter aquaticus]|nr:type 4a pilus biogenesis protein PilO [Candidatus Ancaeobacter aquaticus]
MAKYSKEQLEKGMLIVIFVLAFGAGFWYMLLAPGFGKIAQTKKKTADLSRQIEDAEFKIKNKDKFVDRHEVFEKRIKELERGIPKEADTSWILRTVAEIENDLKFKTEKIEPYKGEKVQGAVEEAENPLFTFRHAKIKLKAGYHEAGKFINTLEKKTKFLEIKNVSIGYNPKTPYQHNVEIKVKYLVLKKPLLE